MPHLNALSEHKTQRLKYVTVYIKCKQLHNLAVESYMQLDYLYMTPSTYQLVPQEINSFKIFIYASKHF